MATVQYEEGMVFYIKDGVAVDAWGREVQGHDAVQPEKATEQVREQVQEQNDAPEADESDREDDRYDDMTADELKDELKRRHEAGREIDITGVRRKADLAEKLREDDRAQQS